MCIYSSHFFSIPFSYDRHLGYFHILATVNNAVIKVVVQISLQEIDFISFRCIPTSPSCSPCTPAQSSITISFSSVQLLSHVRLFATPWTAARQASLSITNSSMSIESVMPSILCCSLLQGIFLTQTAGPCLPHCRQILYLLSHQGSPLDHDGIKLKISNRIYYTTHF